MKEKELLNLSFEMGKQGFSNNLMSAPISNKDFIKIVPNCDFGDDKGCKLRVKMYKSYIKGWTQELLKSMVI